MYGLTPDDLELQARAREFTDELILHEEHDVTEAGLAQEPGRPGTDRSSADDDGVRCPRHSGHDRHAGID